MGVDGDLYQAVLVLHILAVIIGFGGMFIAGFYGNEAKNRPGAEGLAVAETTLAVTGRIPSVAVCAVPILGILLILMSDDLWKFSEAWVSLSFLIYIVLMGLATGVQVPTIRKMVAMRSGAGGAQSLEMQAMGKKVATVSAVVNVLWVVVLILMVFKPGH
ncbi:MAG TPA: DUF2269 family protein [Acidimicrobiales bacterium]|nr:DUF2269 family protein [Acidimicrobiales bacterium]